MTGQPSQSLETKIVRVDVNCHGRRMRFQFLLPFFLLTAFVLTASGSIRIALSSALISTQEAVSPPGERFVQTRIIDDTFHQCFVNDGISQRLSGKG